MAAPSRPHSRGRSKPAPEVRIAPPAGLRAKRFEVDGQELAVLVFPVTPGAAFTSHSPLTSAERQVAELALRGLSNEEIGAVRESSPRTVANQLQSIFRKLHIGSRIELARALEGLPIQVTLSK